MKGKGLAALAVLASLAVMPVVARVLPARAPAFQCSGCSDTEVYQQLQSVAGNQNVQYVVDLRDGGVRRFERQPGRAWREAAVTGPERDYAGLVRQFVLASDGGLVYVDKQRVTGVPERPILLRREEEGSAGSSMPAGGARSVSAWDLTESEDVRRHVIDQLNASLGSLFARVARDVHMEGRSVRRLFGVDDPADIKFDMTYPKVRVDVEFVDGGRSSFVWEPDARSFSYVSGSSRDSENNSVPDTVIQLTGGRNAICEYRFSATPAGAENANRFYRRAASWNVATPRPGVPATLLCSQVDDHPPVCRLE